MEVLFYQVIIFVAIFISSLKSRKVLNLITLIIAIFTITHIFMPWLMIVQFITITIAYLIGRRISTKEVKPEYVSTVQSGKKVDDSTGFFGWLSIIFTVLFLVAVTGALIWSIYSIIFSFF